jgi:hypothetical protein
MKNRVNLYIHIYIHSLYKVSVICPKGTEMYYWYGLKAGQMIGQMVGQIVFLLGCPVKMMMLSNRSVL